MAAQYVLSFPDHRPLGTRESIQTLIRTHFPSVVFFWTKSGQEKLCLASERGVELPPAIRQGLESLPSLLEGVAEGPDWRIEFGLHHLDPVPELVVQPRGDSAALDDGIRAIEQALGTSLRVCGEPTKRDEK
jgi:hypothetical protein